MGSDKIDDTRQKRKEEGKLRKRLRIEESGGTRPRAEKNIKTTRHASPGIGTSSNGRAENASRLHSVTSESKRAPTSGGHRPRPFASQHRFGRVMASVPCRNRPRFSTVSIAVPGSVLVNCQTKELRTLMVGQIARAATIYHVDEIIVFDDKLGKKSGSSSGWKKLQDHKKLQGNDGTTEENDEAVVSVDKAEEEQNRRPRSSPEEFMARLLQYCECPQYLRRHFFPMHPDLQFAGLLAPVDAPHHVRAEDSSRYREGVVLPKQSKDGMSLVNCGIRNRPVE